MKKFIQEIVLTNDLDDQQHYFEDIHFYVSDEKQSIEAALQNLQKQVPIVSLFDKATERFKKIRESLQEQSIHGNIRQLMLRICNLEEIAWEETSNCLKLNAQLSRKKHKKVKKKIRCG